MMNEGKAHLIHIVHLDRCLDERDCLIARLFKSLGQDLHTQGSRGGG